MKSVTWSVYPENFRPRKLLRAIMAEFVGTAMLVYAGCGSVVAVNRNEKVLATGGASQNISEIAFAFGFAVFFSVYALAHVSGGHINPAVSTSLFSIGKISFVEWITYVCAQMGGAIFGAGMLFASTDGVRSSCNQVAPNLSNGEAMLMEASMTFLLVFVVCATIDPRSKFSTFLAPFAIGASVTVCHLIAVTQTGTSVNPARSFGPAVVSDHSLCWDNHWVFWVGPMLGGLIAAFVYTFIFEEAEEEARAPQSQFDQAAPFKSSSEYKGSSV